MTNRSWSPARGVLQVLAVFVAAMAVLWIGAAIPGWSDGERSALGGVWSIQILAFAVVPLLLVRAFGLRPGSLGVTFGGISRPLETGLTALAVLGPATGLGFWLLVALGWSPQSWRGGLVLALVYAVGLPLTGLAIRKVRPTTADALGARHLLICAAVLIAAAAVSALLVESAPVVSRVLLALLVVSFCEELLFRGIVQTRLDQVLGRPWRIFGADLGWGWIIASLLFGIAHLLSPSAMLIGGWALWTAVSGLVFGYIRAKGGSFVASGLVHGVLLAVWAVLG